MRPCPACGHVPVWTALPLHLLCRHVCSLGGGLSRHLCSSSATDRHAVRFRWPSWLTCVCEPFGTTSGCWFPMDYPFLHIVCPVCTEAPSVRGSIVSLHQSCHRLHQVGSVRFHSAPWCVAGRVIIAAPPLSRLSTLPSRLCLTFATVSVQRF